MTKLGNVKNKRMTVSEFEARIPANAKLKRMRIEMAKFLSPWDMIRTRH